MSTTTNNNGRSSRVPNPFITRIDDTYINDDSINDTSTTFSYAAYDNGQSSTWVDSLNKLDLIFSGSLFRLCYLLIDIVLLSLGLYYGTQGLKAGLGILPISHNPWQSPSIPGNPWQPPEIFRNPWQSPSIPGNPWQPPAISGNPWQYPVIPGNPWQSQSSFPPLGSTRTCSVSNALAVISVCILVFDCITLLITPLFFIRNWSLRHMTWSDAVNSSQYRQAYFLRSFFPFLKFISVCVGTAYVFTSKIPANNSCEPIRFYLGIVCFGTWILMLVGPPKPSLPTRRSFILEFFILVLPTSLLSIYIGFVASAMNKTQESECTYTRIEDLYFGAPLKSFAYVGIILAGCTIGINILGTIINQLFLRLPSLRRVFIYLLAIHYAIAYLIVVVFVYYFSVGAILLYQPRSGGSCRAVAPNLYKTLLIWQSIRVFLPLFILSFALLACCLGVVCGTCLAACLPASITVPLLEMLRARLPDTTGAINPNPPASSGTIDALPMVVFGQVADEFNQTECTICRADYEANERLKRLPCGHLFHARCVAHWLSITRICPVCRQRITSANL